MKERLEKVVGKCFEFLIERDKQKLFDENQNVDDTHNYRKYNLDDYDDWSEDEAEDLLTWGKEDLLHN